MRRTRGGLWVEPRDTSGYVYVISHPMWPEWHKVGKAKDLTSRLNSFNTSDPLRRFEYCYTTHVNDANKVEKAVHKALEVEYSRGSEWFKAPLADVITYLEQYSGTQT